MLKSVRAIKDVENQIGRIEANSSVLGMVGARINEDAIARKSAKAREIVMSLRNSKRVLFKPGPLRENCLPLR